MNNKSFAVKLLALIFSGISTFVYVKFFDYEGMNPVAIFGIQTIIFLPILLGAVNKESILKLSAYALLGSTIGFIAVCIINDVGIWPIATAFWMAFSLPSIVVLNLLSQKLRNYWGV